MSEILFRAEEFVWRIQDAFGSLLCKLGRHRWSSWISHYAACERCGIDYDEWNPGDPRDS